MSQSKTDRVRSALERKRADAKLYRRNAEESKKSNPEASKAWSERASKTEAEITATLQKYEKKGIRLS